MNNSENNQISFISVESVKNYAMNQTATIIDVREQHEWDDGHVPNAILIPLSRFQLADLPTQSRETIILYCRSGRRCGLAANIMVKEGCKKRIYRMKGGIIEWETKGFKKIMNKNQN